MTLRKTNSKHNNRLFVSWGGEESKQIAQWLDQNVLNEIPDLDVYLSPFMPVGTKWRREVEHNLKIATHCLGILTDAALVRPWFLYEMFVLQDRLRQAPILRFCPKPVDHPLSDLQMADGSEFESVLGIAKGLLEEESVAGRHALGVIEKTRSSWIEEVHKLSQRQGKIATLQQAISAVNQTLTQSILSPGIDSNACMRELAGKALNDLDDTFRALTGSSYQEFRLDLNRYPEYLIHLQQKLNCTTNAVAVVDSVEEFWAQQTGKEILESTHEKSQRIFVFENAEVMAQYREPLRQHRERYDVFVMSRQRFEIAADPHGIRGDFSVLTSTDTQDAITAHYDGHIIQFTTRLSLVNKHRAAFADIKMRATEFPRNLDSGKSKEFDDLVEEVFSRRDLRRHHSDAIQILRYDEFEEDHPFYLDMHECMLQEFRRHAKGFREPGQDPPGALPILEIGAGTGHFTKRLDQQPFLLDITALEPDPGALPLLNKKLLYMNHVAVASGSALNLNDQMKFAFIFSSFSEHHIQQEQRLDYFSRIYRALRPGGFFIIGDEFLPPHNPADQADYVRALASYHGHIIKLAQDKHHTQLAELEQAAWDSGLPSAKIRVDFKVSLDAYLRDAERSDLRLETMQCISPPDLSESVGGICVAVFAKPA